MQCSSDALPQFSVPVNKGPAIDGNLFLVPQDIVWHGILNNFSPFFLSAAWVTTQRTNPVLWEISWFAS
jgi:hypothetical protein